MDTLSFIAKLVEHAAWPCAAVFGTWLLRRELRDILAAVKRLKAGPVEIEIEKVVAKLEATSRLASAADAKADLAVERIGTTEAESPSDFAIGGGGETLDARVAANVTVTGNDRSVIRALQDGHYVARSLSGLCKATELSLLTVQRTLDNLVEKGLVAKMKSSDGRILWVVTAAGKVAARAS